jgi:hypothetical protein
MMTPEQVIVFQQFFVELHKNAIFRAALKKSWIIFIEKRYLG